MSVGKCPDCQGKVSDRAEQCPHCGAPLHAESGKTFMTRNRGCADLLIWPLVAFVVLALLWLLAA